jgi:hypothetical protein
LQHGAPAAAAAAAAPLLTQPVCAHLRAGSIMLASVLLLALLMVLPAVVVRGDEAEPTGPRCSVGSDPDGQVISFTDQGLDRCLAVIAPPAPPGQKLPVLF